MFNIVANTIHLTRGDVACFAVSSVYPDKTLYEFQSGDVVRFSVYEKGDLEYLLLKKDVPVNEASTSVDIYLTGEDTKIGEIINAPTTYWYEIVINPDTAPQTILGYDLKGAKELILYPEGSDE